MKMYDIVTKGIFAIELGNVRPENIERLLIDNNLNDELCHEKLTKLKSIGINKLLIDSTTFETVAKIYNDGELVWESDFVSGLLRKKAIKFEGQKAKVKVLSNKFNSDDLLDKINETGFDSLSTEEKEFLRNQ